VIPGATRWCFLGDDRFTPREFELLPDWRGGNVGPNVLCKALVSREIDGRRREFWHAVCRQYQFGQPVYFARKIVIVLPTERTA
jgi:hypothetical protein